MDMKMLALPALCTVFIFMLSNGALAQGVPSWMVGQINEIYADPSDVVLVLDNVGPCVTSMFHIKRSAVNFTEMTALMYTAGAAARPVSVYVSGCEGDRNVVSHGVARLR
jgi:hypothetical protein